MLGSIKETSSLAPNPAGSKASARVGFGSAVEAKAVQAAAGGAGQAASKIAHLGMAERIFQYFGRMNSDVRRGGMSLEDMAARMLTVFGVYIPQGFLAVKEDKHKWETNGRNAVVWLMTLGLTWLLKNEKWGTNTILNQFMKPRVPDDQAKGLTKLINPLRLKLDYFDILKKAGIEFKESDRQVAFWSKLDANKLKKINGLYDDLKLKARNGALEGGEQKILEALPGFTKRLNIFPMIATSLVTAATVYLIGDVAMRIVYKFIAPFDHDFDPSKVGKKGKQAENAQSPEFDDDDDDDRPPQASVQPSQTAGAPAMPAAAPAPAPHATSLRPTTFQTFSAPAAGAAPRFGSRLGRPPGGRHV